MDIFNVLRYMHPNAQFIMDESYESITWHSQDIPKPTLQEIEAAYPSYQFYLFKKQAGKIIQDFIDKKAQEKDYGDGVLCASYKDSTNAQWQQEAQAFIAWRDAVWLYAYSELALIQAGEKPIPTIEEFIQSLPDLNW
ncbi:hypothetical protein ACF0MN_10910 [Legionella pneumophila]|uniref:hypothetical protein n=1 Tax=Legionella pneumophila TaxID=446 RepID=UPI0036F49303